MKILFLILCLILVLTAVSQTAVKPIRTQQFGKITVLKVNGYYTDPKGKFKWNGKPPYWYKTTTRRFTIQPNEILISRYITVYPIIKK